MLHAHIYCSSRANRDEFHTTRLDTDLRHRIYKTRRSCLRAAMWTVRCGHAVCHVVYSLKQNDNESWVVDKKKNRTKNHMKNKNKCKYK